MSDFQDVDSPGMFQGLASVHTALPRFANKFDFKNTEEGAIIDIDEDFQADDFDDEDEVYDTSILSSFYYGATASTGPLVPTTVQVMEADKAVAEEEEQEKSRFFSASTYALADFEKMKEEMDELPAVEGCKIFKEIVRIGNGQGKIPERCKIFFHYIAFTEGAAEPFDSTLARRRPDAQDLRRSNLVPGFEVCLKSMEVGEAARFIVPPELAFRDVGVPPRIPPNANILYVVEMLHKIDEELLNTFPYLTAEERAQLPFSQVLNECDNLRADGNFCYSKDSNYQLAIRKWRRAIVILEAYPVIYSDDETKRNKLLWTLYSNMASAYLLMDKPAQACNSCKFGLKVVTDEEAEGKAKLLFRFAKAKLMFKDVEAAKGLIERAAKLQPNDSRIREMKKKIKLEEKAQDESHKDMCGKMMGLGMGGASNTDPRTDQSDHDDHEQA